VRCAVEAALGPNAFKTIVITGHACDEIERSLAGVPVVFAYNSDFANGMALSLRVGLAHAATSSRPVPSRRFWPAIRITAAQWRSRGLDIQCLGNSMTP